ncbi:leucine--tRNA ligase [Candidatus Nanosalina sp. VS9-1]|uniref:leucine--tRNA ligase n=1 Tax=Candidatus Nanosalina sp. VS9-1 TaxID=3388566 RepID=UPI0039DF7115
MTEDFASKLNVIEDKWQEKWQEERVFESDPNNDDKFFITVAYPYPSGGMHIGHVGTYTLPDVFARFKRMQGYNVLFPMAWHVTGTPIIGALNRLKDGEEDQWNTLTNVYNVPEEELEAMEEPMDYANYFIENSYKPNMKNLGFSVDWRREFTTNDDHYNRFIEWQYKRLREKDLVKKGMHPTKYCLNDENPVTTHDLLEGEDAEKQEYTLVKFTGEYDGKEVILPMATLRPETVFGVTHTLADPSSTYKLVEVDGENWIVSEEASEKLEHQDREVKITGDVPGEDIVGEYFRNPVTDDEVIMLPADFVETDSGSGLVMSVPAHAPYDWISLQDLKESEALLKEYGISPNEVRSIEPKQIINTEYYTGMPAEEACNNYDVESQGDEEALEKATEEVYEKEFHNGKLNGSCGDYASENVNSVKDVLIKDFEDDGFFDSMYDFSEEVVCRCGGKVIVAMQESWFLEYGDPGWKDKVQKLMNNIDIIPDEKREDYEHTVDWLESWPAIRNFGLGTKLPFDDEFVVEPLSDSTIYMAFYTIRNIIRDVESEKLDPEFFDYVFNEKGEASEVAEKTGIDLEIVEKARESFDYWYPLDWRTSAYPLIQNHLTFMMYHHTALFEQDDWPQGIATWGLGTLEGKKMSSSKGHVKLPDNAINEYGADTTRFFIFASREPWQDFDWNEDDVEEYFNKVRNFYNRSLELYNTGEEREMNRLDRYALSRLQKIVREATEGLEEFQTRKAGLNAFFEMNSLINRYRTRSDTLNREVVNELVEKQIRLMSPFTPHICEELWNEIGGEGFVSKAEWPEADEELIDEEVEASEDLVQETMSDIREVADIVGDYEEIKIIVAGEEKRELFRELNKTVDDRPEFGEAMQQLIESTGSEPETIESYLKNYLNSPGDLPENVFSEDDELEILEENEKFLEKEFDSWVDIVTEEDSEDEKASRAEPGKPAIILE